MNPDDFLWSDSNAECKKLSPQALENFFSTDLTDDDLFRSVQTVKMLFSSEALPALMALMQNSHRSMELRKAAATAICEIGAETIEGKLREWKLAEDATLRDLAQEALLWVDSK
jgi:hypothetical protein